MCCSLFQRAFRFASDMLADKLGLARIDMNAAGEDELPSDDFAVKSQKRFRRGLKPMTDPQSVPRLSVTIFAMTQYHNLMCFLFGESKKLATDVQE